MATNKLVGADKILRNLNRAIIKIKGRNVQGLTQGALLIQRRSQDDTPVDTGNLKSSHYVEVEKTSKGPIAEIGCQAAYAPWVHENPNAKHKVGHWKFLENAIKSSVHDVLKIIERWARI